MRLALAPVEPQACPGTQHRDSAATLELDLRVDARGDAICADGAAYASLVLSDEGCTLVATTFTREWRNPSEYGSEVAAARLEMKAGEVTASYTRSERGFFFCDRVWRGTATRAPR